MRIEAITLIGARRFDIAFPAARRFGVRQWLAMQIIALAVIIAGPLSATTIDQSN